MSEYMVWTQSVKIFVLHINAHQEVSTMEETLDNQEIVEISIHSSATHGCMKWVAMIAGMQVMHGPNST